MSILTGQNESSSLPNGEKQGEETQTRSALRDGVLVFLGGALATGALVGIYSLARVVEQAQNAFPNGINLPISGLGN